MTVTGASTERYAAWGLDRAGVDERIRQGLTNDVPAAPSRTVEEILRANIINPFNILISSLLVIILAVGPLQDALFGGVMIVNTLIGIIQELKAKQTLDRLALLNAPRALVIREGEALDLPVNEVVQDDVLELRPGDQVVVDGMVLTGAGLEVDESLLTGESDPIAKARDDQVLSGSFVAAGSGRYRATRVGKEAYAAALAEEAKRFTLVRSELRTGIDWILKAVAWVLPPTIVVLVWSQLIAHTGGLREALRSSVAGVEAMVPQGLVLITSVAFAVGVVRLGRRQVLVQELPSIEGLARVDTVCIDKTGTLTLGRLAVEEIRTLAEAPVADALGALAAADPNPNATLGAIGDTYPDPGWTVVRAVPFSSARKWSAAQFTAKGTWVLGAPDVVLDPQAGDARDLAESYATAGKRVVVLAHTEAPLPGDRLPGRPVPIALVVLADQPRPDAAEILDFFHRQDVVVKVISGDHPRTVATVARQVGLQGADEPVDARRLPDDQDGLADALERYTVFGRVTPHQKREMVGALQARGHVVAMTGDGVNDVLALKDADIGIAMGSGSTATRAVAQLVLMDSSFASVPRVVAEGRRVIANIERVAGLYLTKTVYSFLLAVLIGIVAWEFPFLPRHLTIIGSITIGGPSFFLALSPSARRARTGFVWRVLRFSIPAGVLAGAATFLAYWMAREQPGVTLEQARTVATIVLALIGMMVLTIVSRPFSPARRVLVIAMAASLAFLFIVPSGRNFFALELPSVVVLMAAFGVTAITGAVMYSVLRMVEWAVLLPGVLRSRRIEELEQGWRAIEDGIDSGLKRAWLWVKHKLGSPGPPQD